MNDLSNETDVNIDEDSDKDNSVIVQGFYVYDLSGGVYTLEEETRNMLAEFEDGVVADDADGYAPYVFFNEGRNSTVSSATSGSAVEKAEEEVDADVFDDGLFDATPIASDAIVIDTRDDDDADDDEYSQTITTASRLMTALDRGWVMADVYVDDGEIIFIAVRACMDAGDTNDDGGKIVDADYEFNTLRATISSTGGSSNYDTITFSSAVCNSIAGWDLNDVGVEYEVSVDGTRIDTVTGSLGDDLDDVTDLASSSSMKITGLAISSGSHTITVDVVVSFTGDNGADYTVSGTATIRTA